MNIVLLGAGNVATHLALALKKNGLNIVQIYSRTQLSAEKLAHQIKTDFCTSPAGLKEADLYIYALSDNALAPVISQIKITKGIHIHTAGSVDIEIFKEKFENYGALYPLQTFSKEKEIDFQLVPVFVEGNNKHVIETLFELANSISNKVAYATSYQRIKLHIAAVFACNFSNYLYTIASELLEDSQLPFEILQPLIAETATKIQSISPYDAQTGPARRNDSVTIQKHLDLIADEKLRGIYAEFSSLITEKYKSKE